MASRLVIQSLQNNADKKIHGLEDKLKDSKTMVKKVSREYERKLKNVEEDSKKIFKKISREYESNLKNVKDDSNTMLKKVVRKYESKLKHVDENSNEKGIKQNALGCHP
jgi:GTP1/Obg family GTP-binding protein